MPVFPAVVVLVGWILAFRAWRSEDGLPGIQRVDRWIAERLGFVIEQSGESRRRLDLAMSLLVMGCGVAAALG